MKALAALAVAVLAVPPAPPDFAADVLPRLTKAGCNQGTCHGAAIGRGGLHLSLLGDDPAADYDAIVRALGGRRVRLDAPERSLLLLKATGALAHGGGTRFAPGSDSARSVAAWLAAGAPPPAATNPVVALSIAPAQIVGAPGGRRALRVQARHADGTVRDVTPWALYDVRDASRAQVDAAGVVTARAAGVTAVMVRYRGQVAAVRVATPFPGKPPAPPPAAHPVDAALFASLARLNLAPAGLCDDATFLRRAALDLTGTLPTTEDVSAFAADRRPDRRARWVDALLTRPACVDWWTLKLADLLRISPRRFGQDAGRYHAWLREQVARNTPVDRIARSLLVGEGDAAPFGRTLGDPRDQSEFVARTWLGARVACARCHNHPYDRWTRDDYYGFAACFSRTPLPHPVTGAPVAPRRLDGPAVAGRDALARAIVAPPRFAEAFVNRVWKELFGRGLVEPVDDLRPSNPPVHPEVLDAARRAFVASGYDLRALLRLLAGSRAYQQSSKGSGDPALFARAALKPLRAQALADALVQATGAPSGLPARAIALVDPEAPSPVLDALGRCRRDDDPDDDAPGGLAEALFRQAGAPLEAMVQAGGASLAQAHADDGALVDALYRRALARPPTASERAWAVGVLRRGPRPACAADLLWALVNGREFAYNH